MTFSYPFSAAFPAKHIFHAAKITSPFLPAFIRTFITSHTQMHPSLLFAYREVSPNSHASKYPEVIK